MCSGCDLTDFFLTAAVCSSRPSSPRRRCCCSPHRARVRPRAGARDRRADALVADRVRARLHAAPFPLEQVCALFGAWRQSSTWRSCSCATRCSSCRGAATRRSAVFAAAQRRARAAQNLSLPGGLHVVLCCFDGLVLHDRHVRHGCGRVLQRSRRDHRRVAGRAVRERCLLRELHPRCRPGPRSAVARPAAVCVRRVPPRAEVRATPRTQPLTAHAHVLTVCCVCACAQAETRPLLCRRPRRRRLCPPAPPPRRRAAAPPRRRSPQRPPPRRPPPCPPSHRQSAESLRRAASPIRRACAHA